MEAATHVEVGFEVLNVDGDTASNSAPNAKRAQQTTIDDRSSPGNNPLAGKILSASDFGFTQTERVIQLGLKYSF